jgi:hypothetical protein
LALAGKAVARVHGGMRVHGILFLLLVFLGGCASYQAEIQPGVSLKEYRRVWVRTNLNDNHSIHRVLVDVLRSQGFEAESGPLTMMPRESQVIVAYRDRWTWDFTHHMTALEVELQDVRTEKTVASAVFVGPAALTVSPREVVERLVADLLKARPASPPPVL